MRRGTAHARAGDFAAALRCYSQALDVDPLNADAHVAVGAAMANGGELERAARRFALVIAPRRASPIRPAPAHSLALFHTPWLFSSSTRHWRSIQSTKTPGRIWTESWSG